MYYDHNFYEDLDSTMMQGIRLVANTAYTFAKTLFVTVILLAYYACMTPIRIYEYIKEEQYLARKAETDEQIRFNLWKEDANQIK